MPSSEGRVNGEIRANSAEVPKPNCPERAMVQCESKGKFPVGGYFSFSTFTPSAP